MVSHLDRIQQRISEKGMRWALYSIYRYFANRKKNLLNDVLRSKLLIGGHTLSHAIYTKIYKQLLNRKIGEGVDIMEEDWDNLILLDAYRHDYFEEYSMFDGDFSTRVSKGNWSLEFVVKNFKGESYHDTIVVTANPNYQKYSKLSDDTFFTLINLVTDRSKSGSELVTKKALAAIDQYPNKRIIVHYMLPHPPLRGQTVAQVKSGLDGESSNDMFSLYKRGIISKETLEKAYVESIEQVEAEVRNLLHHLDGKTVISSDHGENLGEIQHGMMQLGHGNPTTECRLIPWLEMSYEGRRRVVSDDPIGFEPIDDDIMDRRLAALGYK